MIINKKSDLWRTAPWHVKLSAFGLKSLSSIKAYREFSFWAAMVGVLLGFFSLITGLVPVLNYGFYASGLWFSACMYGYALEWLHAHSEVFEQAAN